MGVVISRYVLLRRTLEMTRNLSEAENALSYRLCPRHFECPEWKQKTPRNP